MGIATIIGSGKRTDPVSAALANALMVRVMDYNDIYWKQDPSHPSDIIPAAMACGERAGGTGKDLVVGIVLGHEFGHHIMNCLSVMPEIDYCNDMCDPDPPTDCGHCVWCEEDVPIAWSEGWANYMGWAIPNSFDAM